MCRYAISCENMSPDAGAACWENRRGNIGKCRRGRQARCRRGGRTAEWKDARSRSTSPVRRDRMESKEKKRRLFINH